jgi:site-specific DNA recombinase
MSPTQVAIYARVSSEQQAEAKTIASQVAALQERVAADGFSLPAELQFIDEGYSGATLIRPALERFRDLVAAGGVERLYVHSPDRLARKYAYQVLLLEEFQQAGVEVLFLNRALGETPEDELLRQVQGMVAEYERAKILERSRRGKRHAAYTGSISVLSGAPYGYRYITKADGGGQARYEILFEEARVVRQVFTWIGSERLTIGEVCRRLTATGEHTRTGKTVWDRSTVWAMLNNPAYVGQAAFGKTQTGPRMPQRLRPPRGRSAQPRRAVTTTDVPADAWLRVPVPPIVDASLFAAVQEQLQENRRHARQRQRGARFLLQGLVCCAACGYAFYGKPISIRAAKGTTRSYAYYRCLGTDAYRFGGEQVCANTQVRTDLLDAAVWQEVRGLLEHPQRLTDEYRRRLEAPVETTGPVATRQQTARLRQSLARLIDSYTDGLIDKSEFEPRITRLRQRLRDLEALAQRLADEAALQAELRLIIGRLEEFAAQVHTHLERADWGTRRDLIRTLVKQVMVDQEKVQVVFRVGAGPFVLGPSGGLLPDRRRRERPPLRRPSFPLQHDPVEEDARLQVPAYQPQHPLVTDPFGQPPHQHVVIDAVEEPLEVEVYDPPPPLAYILPCLLQRLMRALARPEAIAEATEARVVQRSQDLQQCLLKKAVHHGRDAELPHPTVRLRDSHPLHRLWLVLPRKQRCSQRRPRRLQVVRQRVNGHPAHARASLVRAYPSQRLAQVVRAHHRLHETGRQGSRLVGRRAGTRPFRGLCLGFTRLLPPEGQLPGRLSLIPHEPSPRALCLDVRPFPPGLLPPSVLWPRLTAATPSRTVAGSVALAGRPAALPEYAPVLSPRPCRIYPQPAWGSTGFTACCRLTRRCGPPIRFLFVRSWLWLRLPLDPTSR